MTCKDCGQDKPIAEFYKHPQMANGVLGSCKECKKKYQRKLYHVRVLDPEWVENERQRQREKSCRPTALDYMRRWRRSNPEKYEAHKALTTAVHLGKITKPDHCERCGEKKYLHGHHEDYSKPLEVEWLCVKCHRQEHIKKAA